MDPNLFCLSASISACETWQMKNPRKPWCYQQGPGEWFKPWWVFLSPKRWRSLNLPFQKVTFSPSQKGQKELPGSFFWVIFRLQVPNVRGLHTIIPQSNLLRQQVTKCEMFCKKQVFWMKSKWRYAGIPEHVFFHFSISLHSRCLYRSFTNIDFKQKQLLNKGWISRSSIHRNHRTSRSLPLSLSLALSLSLSLVHHECSVGSVQFARSSGDFATCFVGLANLKNSTLLVDPNLDKVGVPIPIPSIYGIFSYMNSWFLW